MRARKRAVGKPTDGKVDWQKIAHSKTIRKTDAIAALASLAGFTNAMEVRQEKNRVAGKIRYAQTTTEELPPGNTFSTNKLLRWAWPKYKAILKNLIPTPYLLIEGQIDGAWSIPADPEIPKSREELEKRYIELWHRCRDLEKQSRRVKPLRAKIRELKYKLKNPGRPRKQVSAP